MQQTKFRVWNGVLHEYRTIDMNSGKQNLGMGFESAEGIGSNTTTIYHSFGDVIEQFTGLHDKNGKPIFEGDIVHGYDQEPDREDGYIGSSVTDVVNLKYGAFWIGDSCYNVMVMTPPIIEVIGNAHTNPELLEAEK